MIALRRTLRALATMSLGVGLSLMSACVGPDLEPPGGASSTAAPGRPANEPATGGSPSATPDSSAAAGTTGKSGPTSADNPNGGTITPPQMTSGAGGSSASGFGTGKDEDAGVADAAVDASSSH